MKSRGLSLILKEKVIIISGVALGLILFLYYFLFLYTPTYLVDTDLFIRNIQKNDVISSYDSGPIIQSESGYSNPLFNLTRIIKSGNLTNKLYDTISRKYPEDLNKYGIESREDWNEQFPALVKAKIEPSTDIINVSLEWVNQNHANSVLNETINEFKKTNLEIRKSVETLQREYLDKQVITIGHQLDAVRKQIRNYKLENGAVDVINESTELTKARIDLQRQAELLRSDVSYYNRKLADLSSQLNFPNAKAALRASAIGIDPYLIKLHQDLSIAQQNYAKLRSKFTDKYPDVIAAKNEINILNRNISKRMSESLENMSIKRGIYDIPSQDIVTDMARVQAEKTSAAAKLRTLMSGINNLIRQESGLPGKVMGLAELQKQEDALQTAYTNAKQAQLEAKIKENQVVDNIVTLNQYSKPQPMLNSLLIKFLGFLAFGFFGALGISWIKEDIQDRWNDSDEIEEVTGKRVLGAIPWIKSRNDVSESFLHERDSIMGIAYKNITANLASKSYLDEAQVLSFVSTMNSGNKLSVVSNISANLAKLDKSVILVDTDSTIPGKLLSSLGISRRIEKDLIYAINEINKHFRLYKSIDNEFIGAIIKEVLIPINVDITEDNRIGFYYLCISKEMDNIYDYIATRGFKIIINFLKKHNEFVLIETPAKPLIFPEVSAITNVSDAVIIISAMETNREGLTKVIDRFNKSNTNILGIISREENSEIEEYFNGNTAKLPYEQGV